MVTEDLDLCYACLCSFTDYEWDLRHSDASGEDVHEDCCDVCHGDDTFHRIKGI